MTCSSRFSRFFTALSIAVVLLGLDATTVTKPIHIPIKKRHGRTSPSYTLSKRDNNIPLYNDLGQVYLAQVSVGTPAQNFTLIIDTQSSDTWIPSNTCKRSMCPLSQFNASASSTFDPLQEKFSYMYGTSSINGTYVKDTVSLGGVSVSHQPFALVDHVDKSIIAGDYKQRKQYHGDVSANGVLGLGFPGLVASSQPYDPLFFSMAKQGLIPELVFSIYSNSVLAEGWSGEMTLGGINRDRYDGEIAYVDVLPISMDDNVTTPAEVAMWVVQGQSIRVKGSNITILDPQVDTMKYVLLDTGTSLSYVGSYYASQLVSAAMPAKSSLDKESGCYIVDCELKNSTEQVDFEFARFSNTTAGTVQVSIPVKELVQPQHLGQYLIGKDDTCIFSICSWPESDDDDDDDKSDSKPHVFIFGDSILRSMYLVFDGVRNQTGFASPVGSQTKVTIVA